MSDVLLESIRAAIMALILGYLFWIGRREQLQQLKGWPHILAGFTLVLFGSLIDITDNYESLNRYVVIGDTTTEALLEKVGGFLIGFSLILVGFLHWLPLVAEVRKNREDLLKYNEELGSQVAARTADLTSTNARLLQEIENRESLSKFPSEDPSPVLRLALDGTVLYANSASKPVLNSWGCEVGEVAPLEWRDSVATVLSSDTDTEIEAEVEGRTISFLLAPITDGSYANLYGRDITTIKELDQMKDDFLSMVSHELRTPLTGIKSSAEILMSYDDIEPETRQEFIGIVNDECDRLTRLINDVLDLARIESGQEQWNLAELSIPEVIDTAMSTINAVVLQKNLSLVSNIEPDLPPILSDRDKLVQVINNLLSNAIKFTPSEGQIEVSARLAGHDGSEEDSPVIRVGVSDNGIGLTSEDCQEVFDKFKQVGESLSDRPKGTGLGLPICNEIIQRLGGSMSVDGELGKGSTFYFTVQSYNE